MNSKDAKIILIDGYTDEPSAFGVPPYISFHIRYIFGALRSLGIDCVYFTIDQIRSSLNNNFSSPPKASLQHIYRPELLILVAGCIVPGKYLRGNPLTVNEAKKLVQIIEPKNSIFGGAAARFGFGGIGGEDIILSRTVKPIFDYISKQDLDATIYDFLKLGTFQSRVRTMNEWNSWAVHGAEIITQHPDFPQPLIVEIETMKGCPRYINGGCNFCIEPLFASVNTRNPIDIVKEIEALYSFGARNFRLGGQTDVYSYSAKGIGDQENPIPNVEAWEKLLTGIYNVAPELSVLHLDNANPAVISQYPKESIKITKLFVNYCTPGNSIPFGLESADPEVINANNLNTNPEESLTAIRILNDLGGSIGSNGMPKLLPGLNFISGLLKESKNTFKLNFEFLEKLVSEKLLLRRINLRQVASLGNVDFKPGKYATDFQKFKRRVRESIDRPMLKMTLPQGRVLNNVYFEKVENGKFTHGRQIGSYPILVTVPYKVPIDEFSQVLIIGHGFRSVSGIPIPIKINKMTKSTIQYIPGIGKKRASRIYQNHKQNFRNLQEIEDSLDDKSILTKFNLDRYISFE